MEGLKALALLKLQVGRCPSADREVSSCAQQLLTQLHACNPNPHA